MRRALSRLVLLALSVSAVALYGGEQGAAKRLRAMGAHVFLDPETGEIREVSLNGNPAVDDATLALVGRFADLTDLSVEETAVGDRGLERLTGLEELEWLNLYRTGVSDAGLETLGAMPSLTHLPLGETDVTDEGLGRLVSLPRLRYLGLRGNRITDRSGEVLRRLKSLTGLHLGQTNVTDAILPALVSLPKLEELWLHDTRVTDDGLAVLADAPMLRRLHLQRTRTTAEGVDRLRERLPACRIFWASDSEPRRAE